MVDFKCHMSGMFLTFCSLFLFTTMVAAQEEKSQCVNCHSELKQLIRLCWEVEKIRPRPPASEENSGEG